MYFPVIYLVGQAGQRRAINGQLFEVVIGLRIYGVVWCRTIPDHIAEGNSVLTKNGLQVVIDCPRPCDPVLVSF